MLTSPSGPKFKDPLELIHIAETPQCHTYLGMLTILELHNQTRSMRYRNTDGRQGRTHGSTEVVVG